MKNPSDAHRQLDFNFAKGRFMRSPIRITLCVVVAVSAVNISVQLASGCEGGNEDSKKPELLSIIVQVTTPHDEPIEGATVRPYGLRTRAERGSHYGWNPKTHGPNADLHTDAEGKIEIQYPKYVTERLETGEISLQVDHEGFRSVTEDYPIDRTPIIVEMTRGRRYSLQAVDATTDEPIVKNVFCELSGEGGWNEWKLLENGTLRSRAVGLERDFLRVIVFPDDGPALFSAPFYLGNQPEQIRDYRLPNIPVEPGRQIKGRLDDTVPRPVMNGHVVLRAVNTIARDDRDSRLGWSDWVPIDAEGHFHFDSVPGNSIVMAVAVCDGYLSAAGIPEELEAAGIEGGDAEAFSSSSQILPLVIRLKDNLDDWTLPMLPTASCRVTVLAPDGSPLPGANVSAWPNQYFPGIGSTVIGDGYSSSKGLRLSAEQQNRIWETESQNEMRKLGVLTDFRTAYLQTTDENGVAVLHTLPGGQSSAVKGQISVRHQDYEMPTSPDHPLRRYTQVELSAEETAEITVRLQPIGTETIGKK